VSNFIFVVSISLCYIKFRSYTLSNTTRLILINFNTYTIILATYFGYVIAIIRLVRTVELALDAALSGMKHLLFASITKIYLKAVIKY
jgi:amino acid permease